MALYIVGNPQSTEGLNDGLVVTNYANYNPAAAIIQSLEVNSTLPNWGNHNGAVLTFTRKPWWNGNDVPVCVMRPPTIEQSSSGIGHFDLWNNGTRAVHQLNLRIEALFSDLFCNDTTQLPKYVIIRTYSQLQPVPSVGAHRPMIFLQHPAIDNSPNPPVNNALIFCPANNTLRFFSSSNAIPAPTSAGGDGDPGFFPSMRQPVYLRAAAGSDPAGNPIYAASEHVCLELRVNTQPTADEPNGVIGLRLYFRNKPTVERASAWTWDNSWPLGNYIEAVEQLGGGYYNNANSGAAGITTEVGRRIGVATNYQPTIGRAWLGAPWS